MNDLIIGALATFGLSSLLSYYSGPFEVFVRLRKKLKALECAVCTSVWVAFIVLALLAYGQYFVVWVFATVGTVILMERLT